MDDAHVETRRAEVGSCAVGAFCCCCEGEDGCLLCVAAELEEVQARAPEQGVCVARLEDALLTARAEAVLLRRLLALAEHQRSEDLVTLAQIEETCTKCGYEPDRGQPVALWIASALESQR